MDKPESSSRCVSMPEPGRKTIIILNDAIVAYWCSLEYAAGTLARQNGAGA